MIKIFRKIRQNLLSKNNFSKYLIYAIGETVLIVIGILIALSLNNWNDRKLNKGKEISILKDFKESIYQDSLFLLNIQEIKLKEVSKSVNILKTMPEYNDSLNVYFDNLRSTLLIRMDNSIYEDVKSNGLNIISNDSLKQSIIAYYQFCDFTEFDAENEVSKFARNIAEPFLFKNFYRSKTENCICWSPKDYSKLVNNPEYLTILLEKERTNEYGKMLIKLSKAMASEIIRLIELELDVID